MSLFVVHRHDDGQAFGTAVCRRLLLLTADSLSRMHAGALTIRILMIGTIAKLQKTDQIARFPVWNYAAHSETSMNISDATFEPGPGWTLLENEIHLWRVFLDKLAVAEKRWR